MGRPRQPGAVLVFLVFFLIFPLNSPLFQAQNASPAREEASMAEKAISIFVPAAGISVDFGVPKRFTPSGSPYLGSGAQIQPRTPEVPAAGEGIVLFSQGGSLLSSGFPRSRDNFIALAHDGGFVSLYSSPSLALSARLKKKGVARDEIVGTIEGARGGQEDNYYRRVIDNSSKLVVNPALFSPGMIDRAAPRIEEVSLIKEGFRLKAEPERRILQRLAQGDYKLAIRLNDPSYAGGVVSGLFRIKVVLDGQVAADRKLDSARNLDEGLGFLGFSAPSSLLADRDMRFLLDGHFLARGNHSLELTVYDFNGNAGTLVWRFIVE